MKRLLTMPFMLAITFLRISAADNLPSNFFMKTLPNGLQMLVIEDASVPLATVEITVHNGSYCEDSAFNGLSHMYEHMFFKANRDLPSQEQFLDRINELGIDFNGTTSNERVNYFITLSNSKLPEGLQFMNSAIRYPLFLESEMKKENPVVDGEFQRNESNPTFFLQQDMSRSLWGDLYTRKNPIGIHEVINTCYPEKMRIIKDKFYYPNNALISVAGDVKHEDVFAQVEKIYSDWQPSGFNIFEKYPIPEFVPLTKSGSFITENENSQIPIIMLGWQGPDTRNDVKATYTADVFSTIVNLRSSKFTQDLVDKGLALQTNMGYQTCKYTGPINVFVVPNPSSLKEAYQALLAEMKDWDRDDYFTDDQLEAAKNQLAITDAYDKEQTSQFLHSVTYWWATADIPYYTNYVENVKKVTRQDIKDYIDKYIKDKSMISGLLINPLVKKQMGIESFDSFFN